MRKNLLLCLFIVPLISAAQTPVFKLTCPLNEATIVPPPANAIKYDEPDLCIVLVSKPDSVVKSVSSGRITNTEQTEETGYGVVLYSKIEGKEYYFWYTGMKKLLVKRNENVKAGQPLGIIAPGERVELSMYEFETPVDPVPHLDCKNILKKH